MIGVARTFVLLAACFAAAPAVAESRPDSGNVLNVRAFGAACNGADDDTTALRLAAAAVPAGGGRLVFPAGAVCRTHGTIYLKSRTFVEGNGATLLAKRPWVSDRPGGAYALLENVHYDAKEPADSNITVDGLTLDYGRFGPEPKPPHGGGHAIQFMMARNLAVTNSTFQVRGAEDALAGVGVHNMRVAGDNAFGFRNCAYDFWGGSSDVRVIGNYARTSHSAQMVNFNPEGAKPGMHAENFILVGNTFTNTGNSGVGIQIEPLGRGTTVSNVVVADNILQNVFLVMRRAITGATVAGNTITGLRGGSEAILSYPYDGGTPDGIVVSGNTIVNPTTSQGLGVIRVEAKNFAVTGNAIVGSGYTAPGIYTGSFHGVVLGNWVSSRRSATPFATAGGGIGLETGKALGFFDRSFALARFVLQGDDNFVFYGTNAQGKQRPLFSVYQHSSAAPLRVSVPLLAEGGLRMRLSKAPAPKAACTPGEIKVAPDAIYVCTGPGMWRSAQFTNP